MSDIVSIIVPFYNSEKYLSKCLESLQNQTYKDFEVILVDDGSKDNSVSICKIYTENDERFHLISQENQGVSSARNTGILNSTGKYITFVDSDDHVSSELLTCLYRSITDNCTDLSVSPLVKTDHSDFVIDFNIQSINKIMYLFETYSLFGPVAKLYRADLIKGNDICFPERVSYGEDLLFNLSYLSVIKTISYVNTNLYTYDHDNDASLSRQYRHDMFSHDMFLNRSLLNWFTDMNLLCDAAEQMVMQRTFDSAYNEIGFMFSNNCRFSISEIIKRYNTVISDAMVLDSLKKADTSSYAGWIVYLLKHRNVFLIIIISLIKRR